MHLYIWMMFILHAKLIDSQVLTFCANSLTGSSCKLTCTTPDVLQTIQFIKLPATAGQEGGCASGGVCGSAGGRTRYTVTQDAALSETYLDISNLVYADDDSEWVCDYGASRSPTVNLTVKSRPTTVHFNPAPTTADLSQLLVMEAFCVYPVSSLTPKLVYQDGQTNSTLDMTYPVSSNNGTNGCGSHEFTVTGSFQLTPTTLSGKRVQFWIEATVAGQVFGSALTTQFFDFPASRVCDDCEKTVIPLGSFGMVFALLVAAFCWLLYCLLSGKCSGPLYERAKDGDIEFTTKKLFWSTVIATVLCLLGFVFCLAGVIICGMCEEGVTTSGKVTAALILVIIGFAFALIIMIVEIILLVLVCCRKIKIKDSTCQRATPDGQEGQPPTTTESNIRTETSPRPLRSPTSASKIKTIWKNNQVSDSNESDASNDTPRGKLSGVPANRQLPPLAMTDQVDARQKANQLAGVPANRQLPPLATTGQVDASQKANQLEPIENTETKKLKKKKKRRSKEEKAQADDEN